MVSKNTELILFVLAKDIITKDHHQEEAFVKATSMAWKYVDAFKDKVIKKIQPIQHTVITWAHLAILTHTKPITII